MPKREKAKVKAKGEKRRHIGRYVSGENSVLTSEEVAERTLNRLRSLGNQVFALFPFSEHFGRWLIDLRVVLSEFESSPAVRVDDIFVKERSQILSNVELELEERRCKEVSSEEAFRSLSDNRILLEQIEEEHIARMKETEDRKDSEIKCLSSNIDGLKAELDRIVRMKTGIFRAMSKKAKAQKEVEATRRLESAQGELTSAVQHFTAEQEKLRDEYERRKQPVIEQMQNQQKEIENQDIDGSLEVRRVACEALINAVSELLARAKA
jgi:hypothetical protein